MGVRRFSQEPSSILHDDDPQVVVFAVAIVALAAVLASFPVEKLAGRLVVDVLSVKVYPKQQLLAALPEQSDLLCTHPMFGPESGAGSWVGLPLVYERARVGASTAASHAEALCLCLQCNDLHALDVESRVWVWLPDSGF